MLDRNWLLITIFPLVWTQTRLVVADGGKLSLVVELVEESRYDKTIVKVVLSILNKPFKGIFIKCLVED